VAAAILLAGMALSLRNYYADPAYARDDYRGIAAYLEAVGRPGDAVVLNAPGQQEVFRYYYDGDLPVYPLPEERPLDPAATQAALEQLARPGGRVFAVLWATGESDPERLVEGWLDGHAYKALDSWYGNVRLAEYSVPEEAPSAPDRALDVHLADAAAGDELVLVGYSPPDDQVAAGDIAQVSLFWQAEQALNRRYKTFVHVLDGANHIVGQRDAEPGGGARPTTQWAPGELVADHLGVPIHPATPPGSYRIEAGMYDAETGRRLETRDGAAQVWLEPLEVSRPAAPAPAAALAMQHPQAAARGDLALLGYDAYRLGSDAQADAPLRPGDVLHFNLYWGAEAQPSGDWRLAVALEGPGGQEAAALDAEPVPGFATGRWQAGDVWRGQFDLPIPAEAPPGRYRLRLQLTAPDGTPSEPILSGALRIGP
jgi:mannosyltransferase